MMKFQKLKIAWRSLSVERNESLVERNESLIVEKLKKEN